MTLLSLRELEIAADARHIHPLAPLSLDVEAGEQVALISEGQGGPNLLPPLLTGARGARPLSGTALFNITGTGRISPQRLRSSGRAGVIVLGRDVDAVFGPGALGPQMRRMILGRTRLTRTAADQALQEGLAATGIADTMRIMQSRASMLGPDDILRAALAAALAAMPDLVIAEGPLSNFDPIAGAGYWAALRHLCRARGISLILLTPEPALAAEMADRVAVFYAGCMVEEGDLRDVFAHPKHPYLAGLLRSLADRAAPGQPLPEMAGTHLVSGVEPDGCPFHPRCTNALAGCYVEAPTLVDEAGRKVACHRPMGGG